MNNFMKAITLALTLLICTIGFAGIGNTTPDPAENSTAVEVLQDSPVYVVAISVESDQLRTDTVNSVKDESTYTINTGGFLINLVNEVKPPDWRTSFQSINKLKFIPITVNAIRISDNPCSDPGGVMSMFYKRNCLRG